LVQNIEYITTYNYNDLLKEFKRVAEDTKILKKALILEMAKRKVAEGISKHKVLKIIINDLKDSANDDYIRKVLGSEYTDQRFNPNRNKEKMKIAAGTNEIIPEKEVIDFKEFIPAIKNTKQNPETIENIRKEIFPDNNDKQKTINELLDINQNLVSENADLITNNLEKNAENEYNPEIDRLNSIINKKDIQINELYARIAELEKEIAELKRNNNEKPKKITKNNAREEYEKNKYYRNLPKIK